MSSKFINKQLFTPRDCVNYTKTLRLLFLLMGMDIMVTILVFVYIQPISARSMTITALSIVMTTMVMVIVYIVVHTMLPLIFSPFGAPQHKHTNEEDDNATPNLTSAVSLTPLGKMLPLLLSPYFTPKHLNEEHLNATPNTSALSLTPHNGISTPNNTYGTTAAAGAGFTSDLHYVTTNLFLTEYIGNSN